MIDGITEAPWIKTELSFVPVKKGADVNISCSYDGLPIPQAEWFFNGYKINVRVLIPTENNSA